MDQSHNSQEFIKKVPELNGINNSDSWICVEMISPDFCRLCLQKSQILKSMFHCSIAERTYAEIYEVCTGYKVRESSQLPNRICNACETSLINYYNFRMDIDNIEEKLDSFHSLLLKKDKVVANIEGDQIEVDNEEQFEIEELYEDEDFFGTTEQIEAIEEVEETQFLELEESSFQSFENDVSTEEKPTTCVFTQNNHKEVKCKTCIEPCQTEKLINELRPEQDFAMICECSKVFKNRRSFTKHFSTVHSKKMSVFQCRGCEETFPNWRSRVAHEAKTHSIGLKFCCSHCGKKFFRSDHFKDHKKSCNKVVEEKFFSCAVCLFNFQREDTYKKHLETAHVGANENDSTYVEKAVEYAEKYSRRRTLNESADESPKLPTDERISCKVCNKTFKNNLSLNKHTSLFHSDQIWGCEMCNEVFMHRSTKISHMSKVHGVRKPFICDRPNCDFSCFKRDRFNAHVEKHDDPDKKFPCPICQQEFNSYNTMTLHRARHLSKNTYVCATCSKQFLDKRNFNVHLKLHTGENLHHCGVCSRGFNRKDHLFKHQERKNHFKASDQSLQQ